MRTLHCTAILLLLAVTACGDDATRAADVTSDAGDATVDGSEDAAPDTATPDTVEDTEDDTDAPPSEFFYEVPLDRQSPWPKFRRDARQTAAAPFAVSDDGSELWSFETGKGIFSSPVIGGDGTIYIGSASRSFYAIAADGSERWSFQTGEIIDSSALLDDGDRVIFGSGDGNVYALDRATGSELWRFTADDPAETGALIRWFEGNIGIGPGGDLYAPNDNFWLYALDRATGERKWRARMPDQTWSLPAVDPDTGRLYVGNNNLTGIGGHLFALTPDGRSEWQVRGGATMAASPTVVGDTVVAGAFDGFIRGYARDSGRERWAVPARDHVYASASVLPNGNVVVPSADGTLYAIDPETGDVSWTYSWGAPMRSSPAVDADGHIYVGTGDGHLLVVTADGELAWALKLIDDDRDDLNGSPALSPSAIVIAGESGEVFRVPGGYCARTPLPPACVLPGEQPAPADGASLARLSRFGSWLGDASPSISSTEALAVGLRAFEGGEELLAVLDAESIVATVSPSVPFMLDVSANRQFLTLRPEGAWVFDDSGTMQLTVSGQWLRDPERDGLQTEGGDVGGDFERAFVIGRATSVAGPAPAVATAPGDAAQQWVLSRLAAPLPTLLPSYNQIGFDSLYFVVGLVDLDEDGNGVAWLVEGASTPDGIVAVPGTRGMFPFEVVWRDGEFRFRNEDGLALEVLSATIGFETFEVAGRVAEDGGANGPAVVQATTVCGGIELYGTFLRALGLCNPDTDLLTAYGAVVVTPSGDGSSTGPGPIGSAVAGVDEDRVVVTLSGADRPPAASHAWSVLLLDAAGAPVVLAYGLETEVSADASGQVTSVSVPAPAEAGSYTAVLMVDAYPAFRGEVQVE